MSLFYQTFNQKFSDLVSELQDRFTSGALFPSTFPVPKDLLPDAPDRLPLADMVSLIQAQPLQEHKTPEDAEGQRRARIQKLYAAVYKPFTKIPSLKEPGRNLRRLATALQAIVYADPLSKEPSRMYGQWTEGYVDDIFMVSEEEERMDKLHKSYLFQHLDAHLFWKGDAAFDKDDTEEFVSSLVYLTRARSLDESVGPSMGTLEDATRELIAGANTSDPEEAGSILLNKLMNDSTMTNKMTQALAGKDMGQMINGLMNTVVRPTGQEAVDLSALNQLLKDPKIKKQMQPENMQKSMEKVREQYGDINLNDLGSLQKRMMEDMKKQAAEDGVDADDAPDPETQAQIEQLMKSMQNLPKMMGGSTRKMNRKLKKKLGNK